jgi:hypothetical protein
MDAQINFPSIKNQPATTHVISSETEFILDECAECLGL